MELYTPAGKWAKRMAYPDVVAEALKALRRTDDDRRKIFGEHLTWLIGVEPERRITNP
jgi:hypothetical protein